MGAWKPETILRKFMERVEFEVNTGCWLWSGQGREGYGRVFNGHRWTGAHRLSFRLHCGEIPDGMVVRHRCDTPACVNPSHLTLGTQLDNIADRDKRGRTGKTMGRRGVAHPMAKLTLADVAAIRGERAAGAKLADIATRYGVSRTAIGKVVSGKRWASEVRHEL